MDEKMVKCAVCGTEFPMNDLMRKAMEETEEERIELGMPPVNVDFCCENCAPSEVRRDRERGARMN